MLRSLDDHRSDLELVKATRSGEPRAVEGFVRRMRCVHLSLAAQNARLGRPLNEHDIEDVSQEVLVLIWNKLGSFAGLSTLETWVYRFTSLELMNAIRRKRTRSRVGELTQEPPAGELTGVGLRLLEYEHLHRALERLDVSEADVIRLKHFEELTFEEIGAFLSMPVNTAKTKYYRGLQRLHEALRSQEPGEQG
jgi:RNA polymerase sigma-70 factor (ECF subfamily)